MDIKKNIILLGATGSIGESSLRLLRKNKERFNLIGVSAHNNAELLSKIVNEFDVPNVVLSDPKNAGFKQSSRKCPTEGQLLCESCE